MKGGYKICLKFLKKSLKLSFALPVAVRAAIMTAAEM